MHFDRILIMFITVVTLTSHVSAQTKPPRAKLSREEKVRADRKKVEAQGFWIYNNLEEAREVARKTNKPLLMNLRCIPCEECVKLDDDLVDRDPIIRSLLEKFVCVRVVSTNGLDLDLFQYDTDQSFAIFLMNADGTIYGRFGTRSHRTDWVGDVSLEGMARALEGALEIHDDYPANRDSLAGKRGKPLEFDRPEKYPDLREKFTAKHDADNPVKSCIHCHQIGEARRQFYRAQDQPIPDTLLYSYPHPKNIGLILDPKDRAVVLEVVPGTPAAKAKLLKGDSIMSLSGQPLVSMADVQWVLHTTSPEGGQIPIRIERDGKELPLTLSLESGWREREDLSWRASTWSLRRMVTGGLLLVAGSADERKAASITDDAMCLRVDHVGEYAPHRLAKDAGFLKGDLVIGFDGQRNLMSESELITYALRKKKAGDQVQVVVLREGKEVLLTLPMQN